MVNCLPWLKKYLKYKQWGCTYQSGLLLFAGKKWLSQIRCIFVITCSSILATFSPIHIALHIAQELNRSYACTSNYVPGFYWMCDIDYMNQNMRKQPSDMCAHWSSKSACAFHSSWWDVVFFKPKILIFFLFLHENICCGYSLEAPRRGTSDEYPQHMFLWRNKKNIYLKPTLI